MSVSRMSAVFKNSKQTDNRRLVLLALADSANDLGHAWPGHAKLEAKTLLERRAIIRHTETIQATSNELMIYRRPGRGNHYLILVGMTQAERLEAVKDFCKELSIPVADLAAQHREAVEKYHGKGHSRNKRKWQTSDNVITTPQNETGDHMITPTSDHVVTTTRDHMITTPVITLSHDPSMNHHYETSEEIRGTHSANGPDGPSLPPTLPEIDLTQSIPAILDALAHQPRDIWERTLFAEQHKPSGKPRKGLITAIQDELSPVRKLTTDETEQALALAQVIAECAYGFRKPVVGSTKSLIMGNVKKIILDLTEMGETTPEPDEMRRAYSKYTADGTKAPRDAAKIIGMLMEVRNGGTKQEPTPQFRGTYSRYNGTPDTWPKPIVLDEQEYLADHADLEADDESERVSDLRGRGLVHRGVSGRVAGDAELPGLPGREGTGNGGGVAPAGHLQPAGVAAR